MSRRGGLDSFDLLALLVFLTAFAMASVAVQSAPPELVEIWSTRLAPAGRPVPSHHPGPLAPIHVEPR